MVIEGEKINLRRVKPADFDKIIKWSENKKLAYFAGERLPKDKQECIKRYQRTSSLFNIIFAIEDKGGNFLGEIELDHIQWKNRMAELFLYIGEENLWGKGYGSDALNTFIQYIYKENKIDIIYLRVYQNNKRAIRCYQKCGFKQKGVLKLNERYFSSDNLILMDLNIPAFINSKKELAFF